MQMIALIVVHVNQNVQIPLFMKAVQYGALVTLNMKGLNHLEISKVIFGKLIIIISFQINVRNAKHFMMNHNVLQCAL